MAPAAAAKESLSIYQAISKISEEAGALAPESKGGVPFAFRGIDGTVAHLAPFLLKYGVITVPKVIDHKVSLREVGNKAITQSEVTTEFTFYAPDGSSISATTVGLAQDYSDRSAAQAQSVAFRVALLQTFALPTHSKEPEEVGEEVQAVIAGEQASIAKRQTAAQSNLEDVRAEIKAIIQNPENPYTGPVVNALGDEVTGKPRAEWPGKLTELKKVRDALLKGQMPSEAAAA